MLSTSTLIISAYKFESVLKYIEHRRKKYEFETKQNALVFLVDDSDFFLLLNAVDWSRQNSAE